MVWAIEGLKLGYVNTTLLQFVDRLCRVKAQTISSYQLQQVNPL